MKVIPTFKEVWSLFLKYIKVFALIGFVINVAITVVFRIINWNFGLQMISGGFNDMLPLVAVGSFLVNTVLRETILSPFLVSLPLLVASILAFHKEEVTFESVISHWKLNVKKYAQYIAMIFVSSGILATVSTILNQKNSIFFPLLAAPITLAITVFQLFMFYSIIYAIDHNISLFEGVAYFRKIVKNRVGRLILWNLKFVGLYFIVLIPLFIIISVVTIVSGFNIFNNAGLFEILLLLILPLSSMMSVWIAFNLEKDYKKSLQM